MLIILIKKVSTLAATERRIFRKIDALVFYSFLIIRSKFGMN